MRLLILLTLFTFHFSLFTAHAQPTDNPYKSRYHKQGHWTDSLPWSRVFPASQFGITPDDGQDDVAATNTAITQINSQGGGVLYFPAGQYDFSNYVKVKTGVILRGATPVGVTDARDSAYAPPTRFEFPQYIFDTLANGGAGTANTTAFKGVKSEWNCKNAGVINIAINRGFVKFQPRWNLTPPPPFSTPQPSTHVSNIIVFGVTTRNAAEPDPMVPRPNTPQKAWQRFCYRFSCNIDINSTHNAVVANTASNRGPSDDFLMVNYLINRRNTTNWEAVDAAQEPYFDYNAHYAIAVNRKKVNEDTLTGITNSAYGYVQYASPENEPSLFASGIEVLDNWVYKTSRVAVHAAGTGLVVKGNVMRDNPRKEVFSIWSGPTGNVTPQGATTFENRGIDVSGWHVLVDSNDVVCYRNRTGAFLTTDGEGILQQECCGGTWVNDYIITRNKMHGRYIGIFYSRDIDNVIIKDNDMQNTNILVVANVVGNTYHLNGVEVEGNRNITDIWLAGNRGGARCFVRDNIGSGKAQISCHVYYDPNNQMADGVEYLAVDPSIGGNWRNVVVPGPCTENLDFPGARLLTSDSTFCDTGSVVVNLKAKLTGGALATSTIDFYLGNEPIATAIAVNASDSTATFAWPMPRGNGVYTFTALARNGTRFGASNGTRVERNCPILLVGTRSHRANRPGLRAWPVPSSMFLNVDVSGIQQGGKLRIYDLTGHQVLTVPARSEINISTLKPGVYLLEATSPTGELLKGRIVVN